MTTATSNPGVFPVWQKWPGMDPVLLTVVLSLLGFSMVMVFSAVAGVDSHSRGGLSLLSKHVFSTALGVAIVLITARINLSLWQRWNRPLLFVGLRSFAFSTIRINQGLCHCVARRLLLSL
mgnify:CR=1 FL=1